jgi:hypothetical protein
LWALLDGRRRFPARAKVLSSPKRVAPLDAAPSEHSIKSLAIFRLARRKRYDDSFSSAAHITPV